MGKFFGKMHVDERIVVLKLQIALLRRGVLGLAGFPLEVTIEPEKKFQDKNPFT